MNTSKTFSIEESISLGWSLFKKHWTFLIPVILVIAVVSLIFSWLGDNLSLIPSIIVQIAGVIVQILLSIGIITIYFNIVDGNNPDWSDFKTNAFLWAKVLAGSILYQILTFLGFLLLIVPGVIFALKWQFFPYVLIKKPDTSIWESFKESSRITKGVRWKLFGLWFVFLGVTILGLLALGVGVFVSSAVIGLASVSIFLKLQSQTGVTVAEEVETDKE